MKRIPLLLAALVPFAALAAQDSSRKVDQQELKDDYRVTRILGAEVRAGDGNPVGTVEDMIFGSDGNIDAVLVQRGNGDAIAVSGDIAEESAGMERSTESIGELAERDAGASEEGRESEQNAAIVDTGSIDREGSGADIGLDPDRADTAEAGDAFARMKWTDVNYDASEEILRMTGDTSMQSIAYDQSGELKSRSAIRASRLVGLKVHLSDERSFGEVEDVLIDSRTGKASALVIDSMEFFDKERYALPVNLDGINSEDDSISLQLTRKDVKDMGEFEMEEILSRQ